MRWSVRVINFALIISAKMARKFEDLGKEEDGDGWEVWRKQVDFYNNIYLTLALHKLLKSLTSCGGARTSCGQSSLSSRAVVVFLFS